MEFDFPSLLAAATAALFVGFFKSTFSMGVGILLVPVMILYWPTRFIIGLIAVVMWVTDFMAAPLFWKQWEVRLVRLVVPGFYVGIFIGTALLVRLPDAWLRKGIGGACLVFAALQAWREIRGELPPPPAGRSAGLVIGVVGGLTSAMFHSGGLILSLFFLRQGLSKNAVVATIIATWLWVNPVKVTSFWVGGIVLPEMFLAGLMMAPLAFAGSWAGKKTLGVLPQRGFNFSLLAISGVTALLLLGE